MAKWKLMVPRKLRLSLWVVLSREGNANRRGLMDGSQRETEGCMMFQMCKRSSKTGFCAPSSRGWTALCRVDPDGGKFQPAVYSIMEAEATGHKFRKLGDCVELGLMDVNTQPSKVGMERF